MPLPHYISPPEEIYSLIESDFSELSTLANQWYNGIANTLRILSDFTKSEAHSAIIKKLLPLFVDGFFGTDLDKELIFIQCELSRQLLDDYLTGQYGPYIIQDGFYQLPDNFEYDGLDENDNKFLSDLALLLSVLRVLTHLTESFTEFKNKLQQHITAEQALSQRIDQLTINPDLPLQPQYIERATLKNIIKQGQSKRKLLDNMLHRALPNSEFATGCLQLYFTLGIK